jgi:hypothetical protein
MRPELTALLQEVQKMNTPLEANLTQRIKDLETLMNEGAKMKKPKPVENKK